MKSAEDDIVDFAEALPRDAGLTHAERIRATLIDTIACAIAAEKEPAVDRIRRHVRGHSGPQMATVWTSGERTSVELAALANAVTAHVLDYDDVMPPMRGHPSTVLWPALVALAEARGMTMDGVFHAYLVGLELIGSISEVIGADHYARGWHSTQTIGTLGATLACSALLSLANPTMRDALGLALAQTGGSQANFGTMGKAFQAGQAAASAIRATLLAESGFTGGRSAVAGANGFLALFGNSADVAFDRLSKPPLAISRIGLDVKKYPMCYAAHRTIDGLLDICTERPDIGLDSIASVDLLTSSRALSPLTFTRPTTGLEAKFSIQYAVAAALADRAVTFASFDDRAVCRPEIQAFLKRVTASDVEGSLSPRWVEITIRLHSGDTIRKRVDILRGSAQSPLAERDLRHKLEDCCDHSGREWNGDLLWQTLMAAEKHMTRDIFPLTAFLAGSRARSSERLS